MDCFFYLWITFNTNLNTLTSAEKVTYIWQKIENEILIYKWESMPTVTTSCFYIILLDYIPFYYNNMYVTYTNLVQLYRFEANETNKTCKPFCVTPAIYILRCLEEILRDNMTTRNIHCMDVWNTTDLTTRSKLPRAFLVYHKSQTAIFVS